MNKKGLILIFLFVLSGIGISAVTNAESTSTKVDITLSYAPPAYVEHDEIYLEFDDRYLADNNIVGQDDVINFGFFYDVCLVYWWSGNVITTGGGDQPTAWASCPQNNWTAGYQGTDLYNVTRIAGNFEVLLDDYGMGWSAINVQGVSTTYQDIQLKLDIGWHYLTIIGSELVSDGNHTTFHWEYAKDDIKFYVAETRHDAASLQQEAWYNWAEPTSVPVNSEDLPDGQNYTVTSWQDLYQPHAYVTSESFVQVDEGIDANITTAVEVTYNATDTEFKMYHNETKGITSEYVSLGNMGPHTIMWFVNDGAAVFNSTHNEDPDVLPLLKGSNIVYFAVFGFKADSWSVYPYYLYYYAGTPYPVVEVSLGIIRIQVGEPESTGPGFGIFISVSMLGLVAALAIMRRRK